MLITWVVPDRSLSYQMNGGLWMVTGLQVQTFSDNHCPVKS